MLNARKFHVLAYHGLGLLSMQFVKCKSKFRCFVLLLQPLFYIKVPDGREKVWSRLQRRRWTPGWCLGIAPSWACRPGCRESSCTDNWEIEWLNDLHCINLVFHIQCLLLCCNMKYFTLTFLDLTRAWCWPTELGGTWIKGYSDFAHKETGSGGPFRMV